MLLKIICLILIVLLAFLWWKHKLEVRLRRDIEAGMNAQRPNCGPYPIQEAHEEKMVRCARCDMFVPISEAVFFDGKFYCSDEHAHGKTYG